jgi:AraC family transcriptional regulator of adaptative response/methylated-DNA-[protein]-cysteine methyltransferase
MPPDVEMEKAFYGRDGSFDGVFYAAVATTGIFCKPSCPARKPKRENVRFYATAREALFAGFRPCERCKPLEAKGQAPAWLETATKLAEDSIGERVADDDMRAAGLDPVAVRRWWKREHGMTFHAYCRARRLAKAFESIRAGSSVDDAILDSGWQSFSGFREAYGKLFGSPPGAAKPSAKTGDYVRLAWLETPLGPMVAGADETAVRFLEFSDRRAMEAQLASLRRTSGMAIAPGDCAVLETLRAELAAYFAGTLKAFTVPTVEPGSAFQARVWKALVDIPYGQTRSYAQLAEAIGSAGAARAVGAANGLNRIAVIVPCHRVVNADGQLGGYGGGLWRKRALLELERRS